MGHGNNPEPVAYAGDEQEKRCCNWCAHNVVAPARIYIANAIVRAEQNSIIETEEEIAEAEKELEQIRPGVQVYLDNFGHVRIAK